MPAQLSSWEEMSCMNYWITDSHAMAALVALFLLAADSELLVVVIFSCFLYLSVSEDTLDFSLMKNEYCT